MTTINGTNGNNSITLTTAAGSSNTVNSGNGNDTVTVIAAAASNTTVNAGNGNDTVSVSGAGNATINAGNGSDTITVNSSGNTTINSGHGSDTITVSGSGSATINTGNGSDIVNLSGSSGANTVSSGNGSDIVLGGSGNDCITGGNGTDVLSGGAGNDRLTGGNGSDTLYGGVGNDILLGGNGRDVLIGGSGSDQVQGSSGADLGIYALSDHYQIVGSSLQSIAGDVDRYSGGDGADTLRIVVTAAEYAKISPLLSAYANWLSSHQNSNDSYYFNFANGTSGAGSPSSLSNGLVVDSWKTLQIEIVNNGTISLAPNATSASGSVGSLGLFSNLVGGSAWVSPMSSRSLDLRPARPRWRPRSTRRSPTPNMWMASDRRPTPIRLPVSTAR